ncbi:cell wall-binding repeat-containing protein [Thermococcus sp.]|uniref:cell wall-binding repeat-containing protein n=1 Tax=Thermococcus sp. TaxID=35749 RepID=UPI0025CC7729|nr:hypothetical protein [Thermococcus sp.]
MIWKKLTSVLIGLIMLSTAAAVSAATSGGTPTTVILVSDNAADSALAHYIANVTGSVVVTTPWGVYDPNVTAEITGYGPDLVIIIGGPDAVPQQYTLDLQNIGITVKRWWGATRYGTNIAVIKNATVELGIKFKGPVIIVPGNDTVAIQTALQNALRNMGIILLANKTTNITRVMEKIHITPHNVTVIQSHVFGVYIRHVMKELKNQTKCNCIEINVSITANVALKAISISERKIEIAKQLLQNMTQQNVTLRPGTERIITQMIKLAEKEVNIAKEAYNQGYYGRAYGQAIAAGAHADIAIKLASHRWLDESESNPRLRGDMTFWKVNATLRVLEKAGVNVTLLRQLLKQLKEAIISGNREQIWNIIEQIHDLLRQIYRQNLGMVRAHAFRMHHHGRG